MEVNPEIYNINKIEYSFIETQNISIANDIYINLINILNNNIQMNPNIINYLKQNIYIVKSFIFKIINNKKTLIKKTEPLPKYIKSIPTKYCDLPVGISVKYNCNQNSSECTPKYYNRQTKININNLPTQLFPSRLRPL